MINFANLFADIDATTKTNDKVAAMKRYFDIAPASDAAWATFLLSGNKLGRIVPTKLLRIWAAEVAEIPDWLFDESYQSVGDLAETISLIVCPGDSDQDGSLTHWITDRIHPLRGLDENEQKERVLEIWRQTDASTRLVVMKLLTGGFRLGVSKRLVTRAIAEHAELTPEVVSHRLMGNWQPTAAGFQRLTHPDVQDTIISQPYPFCLAHPIDVEAGPEPLGSLDDYAAEWKWDGIRGQLIRRDSSTFIWSRGEEMMENRWPEIEAAAEELPEGTVLDGEILASTPDGAVLPFAQLQRRIGRKKVGKKLLSEVPVVFHAFDLLERDGEDLRAESFASRRSQLERLLSNVDHDHLRCTDLINAESWESLAAIRETSRERCSEGLMLKRKDAPYDVGRVRGTWWKWKIAPYTIDAVLIYAQKGHGRRASLYTDYTFALWSGEQLVPFAKAYSGLSNAEIKEVDRFIRQNTQESFGPVRSVTPTLVMELAFEGLQRSKRHKSGVATRFPRIVRWRHDKKPADANTLNELLELLPPEPSTVGDGSS